nr:twin-arginine translocation signal domain-containing protein [Acidobacteriota bacterium]
MSASRRDFIKTIGAGGVVLASGNLIADILAQSPAGDPMSSRFKGLSDIALNDAKRAGCSYADIRFTRNQNAGANANGGNAADGGGPGGGG